MCFHSFIVATYWENSCSFGLRYVSWYKYLIVSLAFSYLGFWSGNLFLIVPFPDLCLLVPFNSRNRGMDNPLFVFSALNRHFSLLNVNFAGACGYNFVCNG